MGARRQTLSRIGILLVLSWLIFGHTPRGVADGNPEEVGVCPGEDELGPVSDMCTGKAVPVAWPTPAGDDGDAIYVPAFLEGDASDPFHPPHYHWSVVMGEINRPSLPSAPPAWLVGGFGAPFFLPWPHSDSSSGGSAIVAGLIPGEIPGPIPCPIPGPGPNAPVPEPGAGLLFAIASLLVARRLR